MASIATNIDTIKTQAAVLDSLITSFKAARAIIDAAENEIRIARGNPVALSGQERLALTAHMMMIDPTTAGGRTIAQLADYAWDGVA